MCNGRHGIAEWMALKVESMGSVHHMAVFRSHSSAHCHCYCIVMWSLPNFGRRALSDTVVLYSCIHYHFLVCAG